MKNKIMFLLVAMIFGSQIVIAGSYQRWIFWINEPTHQVTMQEMATITQGLYNGEIKPNEEVKIESGIIFKIPQPNLYLEYIEKCVRASDTLATTPKKVMAALYLAEKRPWGNDFSEKVKNYYFSTAYNCVKYNDNYSGEDMDTDFLWIKEKPTIKCDCGNPLENIKVPQSDLFGIKAQVAKTLSVDVQLKLDSINVHHSFDDIHVVFDTQQLQPTPEPFKFEPEKKKWFQKKAARVVGSVIVLTAVGYGGYKLHGWLLNKKEGPVGVPSYPAVVNSFGVSFSF